jgi:hypothetical protein
MKALRIYAGPKARLHIEKNGLRPEDIGVVPGAAGGPKGLILGALDRFIFGDWLTKSSQTVHLVGASIGAWRMATACLTDPAAAFRRLERDYIHMDYKLQPAQKRPSADIVSEQFGQTLKAFYGGRTGEVLEHPRYRLHIVTSRGRHLLRREHKIATPLGYLGAFVANSLHRKAMGAWLERVVFSSHDAPLPFNTGDYRTRQVHLNESNFQPALQASCSIPFALRSVHDIPGAPTGAYWDGGITDYHLHLNYQLPKAVQGVSPGLVLYPHFQKAIVPGWLDKGLKWRHGATPFLDNMVVLAPSADWVKSLANSKLPDRADFAHYGRDLPSRIKAWSQSASQAGQLADEFASWVQRPDASALLAL